MEASPCTGTIWRLSNTRCAASAGRVLFAWTAARRRAGGVSGAVGEWLAKVSDKNLGKKKYLTVTKDNNKIQSTTKVLLTK
jgi:hypothetical protein